MSEQPTAERQLALDVVTRLQDAGHEAVFAGGCVRDMLLGQIPSDYDVATSASPSQVRTLFGQKRTLAVGESFGVIIVLGRRDADGEVPNVEVATFRADGTYSDGRRPDAVRFCSAAEDAARRDFTINAVFFDPLAAGDDVSASDPYAGVIDYVGGLADFDSRTVRAVGDPRERFEEDKLRMLRAVRFAQRLGRDHGFTIEPATRDAIVTHAPAITQVSWERITQELTKMLAHPARSDGIAMLESVGLRDELFPELGTATAKRLEAIESARAQAEPVDVAVPLAAMLLPLPIGTRRDTSDVGTAHGVLHRMKVSNELRDRVVWLLASFRVVQDERSSLAMAKPLLASDDAGSLLLLARSQSGEESTKAVAVDYWSRYRSETPRERLDPPPLVSGGDLIGLGLRPGPRFKQLLQTVRDRQLNEELTTREEAVAIVQAAAADEK